jgi:hypothetical protein
VSEPDLQGGPRLHDHGALLDRERPLYRFGKVAPEADWAVIADHNRISSSSRFDNRNSQLWRAGHADRDRDRRPRGRPRRMRVHDGTNVGARGQHGEVHRQLDARPRPFDQLAVLRDEADVLGSKRRVLEPARRDRDQLARARARVPLRAANEPAVGDPPQGVTELGSNR